VTPRRGTDRSNQILDAASSVFARLGFAPARMDDVAAESGLSKGALYLYFRSKEQLIDALVVRMIELETRRLSALRRSQGTVADRLLRFAVDYTDEIERLGPLVPIVLEVYARATRHRDVREALQRYFEGFRSELAGLVADGVARGEFRAVDADAVAVSITGLLEGLALLWGLDRDRVPISGIAQTAMRLLLAGLRPDLPGTQEVTP
jgi:AcrR family transcriptional regulator